MCPFSSNLSSGERWLLGKKKKSSIKFFSCCILDFPLFFSLSLVQFQKRSGRCHSSSFLHYTIHKSPSSERKKEKPPGLEGSELWLKTKHKRIFHSRLKLFKTSHIHAGPILYHLILSAESWSSCGVLGSDPGTFPPILGAAMRNFSVYRAWPL